MLLPKDINPETSIYYYGSLVLKELSSISSKQEDIINLYHNVKIAGSISITSFSLTLDWLYLIGAVKINNEGKVILCS
ncbi:hypothetical protein E0F18_02975 [Listeria monocytogenes]|uniref:ABC-three component system middle component 6 n=1 Tax=Listeria monocytogenes TaxID=1639 RepID=UPI00103EE683|nr:ABC-three component system middle component 6 [Listeria monocytogenes]EAF2586912.1 hypothetical protein [Listeria monocytogenes]EAG5591014.1 hypothetical protein [Listeria monocytogenes]MBI1420606.1 hypothetical protein [Listeria monocytogenes]NVS16739.1 hypothetical protein [Listeria monocytogenes]TCD09193.1 hypothetical protein E0F18_02975 [Listeria monocytogenes]